MVASSHLRPRAQTDIFLILTTTCACNMAAWAYPCQTC